MTPHAFITKWRNVELKERSASQAHFLDLCRLLDIDDPVTADPKRTLTNLYNARPAWLDHAHKALDEAVAGAYGWGDDWRAGALTDDEILARLFHLNQQRTAR